MNINAIKQDIISFADDENDVIFSPDGSVLFTRLGEDIEFKLEMTQKGLYVNYKDTKIPYKKFLSKEIAKLDVFANKLIEKKDYIEPYIDANAQLFSNINDKKESKSLLLLQEECNNFLFFGTKITFVTADAGHGKTVLLKEFQRKQAEKYLEGNSDYIFWHIDLLGRDLVRLNEAIMYDLGLLRIAGLYYSSILTLIRHNIIILGIDGFDELAAEIGGENALGSLSNLVLKMDGQGTLIAASRRTFFNTQDYIKRTKLLQKNISGDCEFNELKIKNWNKEQNIEYLGYYFNNPEKKYNEILSVVKQATHPILARPYLFTKIIGIIADDGIELKTLINENADNFNSINVVIEAFVKREVLKWRYTDKDTGKPYLTFDQHIELLSMIAQEMWEKQIDIISIENIQFILTILFDEWNIEDEIKSIRMVESHALLIPVPSKDNYRKFDHVEFKNYFIAKSFAATLKSALKANSFNQLKNFLYIAQLPDSVANYFSYLIKDIDKEKVIKTLLGLLTNEWKPTYLQPNIGTILPYLLDRYNPKNVLSIKNKLIFSSLIFENKSIMNIKFNNSDFINISFNNTFLKDVEFINSSFNEIRLYSHSKNNFNNVKFTDCKINAIIIIDKDGNEYAEYSPNYIQNILEENNFIFTNKKITKNEIKNTEFNKQVKRFLYNFNKSIYQYKIDIENEPQYHQPDLILMDIIPMLIKHKIIEQVETKKSKQINTTAWRLKIKDISAILKAEEDKTNELYSFWKEVNEHE